MNKQERDEVAELILRAVRLAVDAAHVSAIAGTDVHARLVADEHSYTAQRELWEALFRIRLDNADERA